MAERTPDPLAELLEGALARDPKCLRGLLERVGPDVARVVRTLVGGDAPDIDDLVQDSLLAFVRALPAYRGEASVVRYARKVAARTTLVARKKSRRRARIFDRFLRAAPPMVAPPDPVEVEVATRRRAKLAELLATLSPEQSTTFLLRNVLEHDLGEIAELTGAPVNTVRSRLRLARAALRKRIAADPTLVDLLEGQP